MLETESGPRRFVRLVVEATLGRLRRGGGRDAPFTARPTTPDQALAALMEGNRHYVAGRPRHPDQRLSRRVEVSREQHPFAIILGCADSRVPPELVFDQGLGDLFVVRVAGNIASDDVMGSIEFAAQQFGTPLVMVLGHARCGAVTATLGAIDRGTEVPGHITSLVAAIRPVAQQVGPVAGDRVETVVSRHAREVARTLVVESEILARKVEAGTLRVVSAYYSLDDGSVRLLD